MNKKARNLINNFLKKTIGYQLSKVDATEGQYRPELIRFINARAANIEGKEVLDVGAGSWTWVKDTFKSKARITSFDQTKWPDTDIVGDIHELGKYVAAEKFDAVLCLETMEHVRNPFVAIEEIRKTLKKGGLLIASTPFRHMLHGEEYGDYWRITRQGWKELLSGFEDIQIEHLGEELMPHHYMVSARKK